MSLAGKGCDRLGKVKMKLDEAKRKKQELKKKVNDRQDEKVSKSFMEIKKIFRRM